MQLTKVIKLELQAEEDAFRILDGQSRICNWLYNHLLELANHLKKEFIATGNLENTKTIYTERGLRNQIPTLKKEKAFLKSIHSSPLKNTALRLSQSIQAHQKGKKGKRKAPSGWPRFRSWQAGWFSLYYDEPKKGFKVTQDTLKVSLGVDESKKRLSITFQLKDAHLLKNQDIRNLRLVKQAGHYYAVFTVQIPVPEKKPIERVIALDPNHKNMCHGVDTNGKSIEVAAPRWLKGYDKRLDGLFSKRDRCQKKAKKVAALDQQGKPIGKEYFLPSKRWRKFQHTIEKTLHKRQEQTKTFMYTLSHSFCRSYDCIAIGDYTPQGDGLNSTMRRAMNNRSLIGRFKETLFWTATKSGKTFVEYDEKGTTRTCHACGYQVPGGLCPSCRHWQCPNCMAEHHRDENAAINGLQKILRDLKKNGETIVSQVPCSGLASVEERWAWRVLPSGVATLRGGKNGEQSQRQEMKSKAWSLSAKVDQPVHV